MHRPKASISSSVSSVKPGTRPSIFSSFSSWSPGMNRHTRLPSASLPDSAFTVEDSGMFRNAASSAIVCTSGVAIFSMASTSYNVGRARHAPASASAA